MLHHKLAICITSAWLRGQQPWRRWAKKVSHRGSWEFLWSADFWPRCGFCTLKRIASVIIVTGSIQDLSSETSPLPEDVYAVNNELERKKHFSFKFSWIAKFHLFIVERGEHKWRSEDNLQGSVLFFHHVGSDGNSVVCMCLCDPCQWNPEEGVGSHGHRGTRVCEPSNMGVGN